MHIILNADLVQALEFIIRLVSSLHTLPYLVEKHLIFILTTSNLTGLSII